jgi:hypothetical protein
MAKEATAAKSSTENEVRFLENRKVRIKPVIVPGRWSSIFEDERPNEAFMYPTSKRSYDLPNKAGTLQKVSVLDAYEKVKTPDYSDLITEQEFFERKLFKKPGELSIYNAESTFWRDFRVMMGREGLTLDLKDPIDMLKYKVLLANKNTIAPSWDDRFGKGSYEFAVIDESVVIQTEKEQGELEDRANFEFLKIKDNTAKLSDILRLRGFKVPENSRPEFIVQEVRKLVKATPSQFLTTVNDPMFESKVLLKNALRVRALEMPKPGVYALPGGILIGTEREAITYIEQPENATIKQRIINQIEVAK